MCGLFGFSLKLKSSSTVARLAMAKLKVLGLYNQTRGKDSCGVFISGEVIKGIDKNRFFDEFIESIVLPHPKDNLVVIAHTRSSTRGANTGGNAHPYVINDDLIGAHNGTINNIDELCKKYDLNPKDYDVDSQALYHMIDKVGYEVLNEYKGYAALTFTRLSEPNTLYIYHGASRTIKEGTIFEERPMYILEADEGIYYSSLEESLKAIRENENHPIYNMNYNVVLQIKDGRFTNEEHIIEREDKNIFTTTTNSRVGNAQKAPIQSCLTGTGVISNHGTNATGAGNKREFYEPAILREALPMRCLDKTSDNYVYYHQGRYWHFKRKLCQGIYYLMDKGFIANIPGTVGSKIFYFYKGVMLRDEKAYKDLLEMEANKDSFIHCKHMNFANHMSNYSRVPVTNMLDEALQMDPFFRWAWYCEGKRYDGSFTPKFSGRHYTMTDGILKEIKSSHKKEEPWFKEYKAANYQLKVFNEGLKVDVPGGTSQQAPFREYPAKTPADTGTSVHVSYPAGATEYPGEGYTDFSETAGRDISPDSPGESDSEEKRFYEVRGGSYEEVMELMGPLELKALRLYCKKFLESNSPLEVDAREVEMSVCELITIAVKNGKSIEELCDCLEDRQSLISCYDQVLAAADDGMYNRDNAAHEKMIEESISQQYKDDIDRIIDEIENDQDMNAVEAINSTIDSLETMIGDAESLTSDVNSDFAQETARALFVGVSSMSSNLASVAEKFKEKELLQRIRAINSKRTV